MRMARLLFYNDGNPEWRHYHPSNVNQLRPNEKACSIRMTGGHIIDLDMSEREALVELNAAMAEITPRRTVGHTCFTESDDSNRCDICGAPVDLDKHMAEIRDKP